MKSTVLNAKRQHAVSFRNALRNERNGTRLWEHVATVDVLRSGEFFQCRNEIGLTYFPSSEKYLAKQAVIAHLLLNRLLKVIRRYVFPVS